MVLVYACTYMGYSVVSLIKGHGVVLIQGDLITPRLDTHRPVFWQNCFFSCVHDWKQTSARHEWWANLTAIGPTWIQHHVNNPCLYWELADSTHMASNDHKPHHSERTPQTAWGGITLDQCWANVAQVGPRLSQRWTRSFARQCLQSRPIQTIRVTEPWTRNPDSTSNPDRCFSRRNSVSTSPAVKFFITSKLYENIREMWPTFTHGSSGGTL